MKIKLLRKIKESELHYNLRAIFLLIVVLLCIFSFLGINISKHKYTPFVGINVNKMYDAGDLVGIEFNKIESIEQVVDDMIKTGYLKSYDDLERIKYLDLTGVRKLNDISLLAKMTNLEYLEIELDGNADVKVLGSLYNIEYLRLYHESLEDLKFVEGLNKLETIEIHCPELRDVSMLLGLSNIKTIIIHEGDFINNIDEIYGMKDVEVIIE